MITSAAHTLAPTLSASLQQFGAQLQAQRASAEPSPADPAPDRARVPDLGQARRDAARQAAVFTVGLQSEAQQTMALLESVAPIEDDCGASCHTSAPGPQVDPAQVYSATREYQRRMDLIGAFESASSQEADRPRINILV